MAEESIPYGGINCFPDMDMLIVGMNGEGHVGLSGCTADEYRLHFSLWALLGSPLMIGYDVRKMDDTTRSILMNREALAINQDAAYHQAYDANRQWARKNPDGSAQPNEFPIYVRLLDNGDFAIGSFNFSDFDLPNHQCNLPLALIGLPEATGKTLRVKELWTGEEFTVKNGILKCGNLKPHCCHLYRAKVVDR